MNEIRNSYITDVSTRDEFIKLVSSSFVIPEEFRPYFVEGIIKFQNKPDKPLTDKTVEKMVATEQSLNQFIKSMQKEKVPQRQIGEKFGHWKGYFAEWVTCLEYNSLINKGNVIITIVNPDTTSKADLLHLVKTNYGYQVFAGPDVKTGSAEYVLTSYEKLLREKIDIPFLDAFGHLTHNKKALGKAQRKRLDAALEAHPGKGPLAGLFSTTDYHRLIIDYLAFEKTCHLPSERVTGDFKLPKSTKTIEDIIDLSTSRETSNLISWEQFRIDFSEARVSHAPLDIEPDPVEIPSPVSRLKDIDEFDKLPHVKQKIDTSKLKNALNNRNEVKNEKSILEKFFDFGKNTGKVLGNLAREHGPDIINTVIPLIVDKIVDKIVDTIEDIIEDKVLKSPKKVIYVRGQEGKSIQPREQTSLNKLDVIGTPKRPHERRGHPRHYKDGRSTTVKQTQVNKPKDSL